MKIITSSDIQSLNDKKSIEEKKHTKEITRAVNPPKMRARRTPAPRKDRVISASRLKNILKYQSNPISDLSPPSAPKSQYKEYKNSMKETSINLITSIQPEYADTIKDKIMGSKDIVDILSDKLMDLDMIENEWLVLGLTVAGKFLEANNGI